MAGREVMGTGGPSEVVEIASEVVEIEGHILDSLILAKVLDLVVAAGADYQMLECEIGRSNRDPSRARILVEAPDEGSLATLLVELQAHGANRVDQGDAQTRAADRHGVLPGDFYPTTNLATSVRLDGHWVPVAHPEMDCCIVARRQGSAAAGTPAWSAATVAMHRVRAGDQVVVGHDGVRVASGERPRAGAGFRFMTSAVSSEKPKARAVAQVAGWLRQVRSLTPAGASTARVLAVPGPAVIHTGAGPDLARLVRDGWIDAVFSGNGFAAHDIEADVMGTSLGVPVGLEGAGGGEGDPANHLRVINEVRRHGSIAAAVEAGYVRGGVMYECVRAGVPFVLGGSLRDDGPLPDVVTDVVEAADAMRALVAGVGTAVMMASTLHAIATGNLLPANVQTFCVDINQAVVTKLADRGSRQAVGIVTDVGPFLRDLADQLCGPDPAVGPPGEGVGARP